MTVKDALKLAFFFLGKNNLLAYTIFGGTTNDISSEDDALISKMIKCLDLVIKEIATDYVPLRYSESITVCNNQFDLSVLTKSPVDIISLKTPEGNHIKFKCYPEYIECANGTFNITYNYEPNLILTTSSDIPQFYGKLDERVFAYGIAREFCYVESLYEDASMWETRYKACLLSAVKERRNCLLAKRGWI